MSESPAASAALRAVDRYLAALNARDTTAIRDAFNFPHLRIGARGNLSRFENPEDYDFGHFFRATEADGWHHTKWDRTEVVFATEGKAHVAVDFTRYREDGSVIGRYFSLYIVTCQDGHWGIQVGSGNGA
ncbi:MAG TPA: hypothetical protein VIS77_02390 [Burkholderiales bacterium]